METSDPSTSTPTATDAITTGIIFTKPHDNDVLSGRGNFVNHHAGNENFRKLVKFHKKAYVACPKAQKAIYSKIIYDEIRAMTPPGRFLKQDPKTKLWSAVGEKKALDKTRQALREGAPELLKEIETGTPALDTKGIKETKKRGSGAEDFVVQLQRMQGIGNNIPMPMGVASNPFGVFGAQGPNSILAAAAQLQAAQQQGHQKQQLMTQSQLETQVQLLKMQMGTQQLANLTAAQQGAMRNNNQSAGFNAMAAAAQAQAANSSINLPIGGSNDMTAMLAAMMNNMPGANPAAVMAYQQQLAQVAMFNQMNSIGISDSNMNNTGNSGNSLKNLGSTRSTNPKPDQPQSKSPSDSSTSLNTMGSSEKSNKRKSEGLNSSFTRAQRIGLKNSLTQRRPNRNLINADLHNSLNSTLKNSLMSIESLTLDDIDSSGFDGAKLGGVFEDSDNTVMK